MPTDIQIDANKRNARHSNGPVTDPGKIASSQNSFRHGLTASAMSMIAGEKVEDYMDLANGLRTEHKPATITEDVFVTKMIESLWLGARAVKLQQRILFEPPFNENRFNLYMRYQIMHDRASSKALADLHRFRNEARKQEIGFVSQQRSALAREAKIRKLNASTAALERAVQLRKSRPTPPDVVVPAPPAPPYSASVAKTRFGSIRNSLLSATFTSHTEPRPK